jgi:hypothetical protein
MTIPPNDIPYTGKRFTLDTCPVSFIDDDIGLLVRFSETKLSFEELSMLPNPFIEGLETLRRERTAYLNAIHEREHSKAKRSMARRGNQ